jgi:multidrug efflux pump
VKYSIPYDSSLFIDISIRQVAVTLVEAIILVFLVMFFCSAKHSLYTIIPIVMPIALLGTFATLLAFGFFPSTLLTMFVVLVIRRRGRRDRGVVERRTHHGEEGLSPLEATRKTRWGRSLAPSLA